MGVLTTRLESRRWCLWIRRGKELVCSKEARDTKRKIDRPKTNKQLELVIVSICYITGLREKRKRGRGEYENPSPKGRLGIGAFTHQRRG